MKSYFLSWNDGVYMIVNANNGAEAVAKCKKGVPWSCTEIGKIEIKDDWERRIEELEQRILNLEKAVERSRIKAFCNAFE
jgi:hypothetical protein